MGSGKSSVARMLRQYGYCVWDADDFSRQVLFLPHVASQIKALFGDFVFVKPGHLDRPLVRQKIFADPKQKQDFEDIIHPAIADHFHKQIENLRKIAPDIWIFYEASLIFEKNRHHEFDACVVVTSDADVRKQRLMRDRNLSESLIQSVLQSQWPDDQKIKHADHVIDNSGDLKSLDQQVKKLILDLHAKWFNSHDKSIF